MRAMGKVVARNNKRHDDINDLYNTWDKPYRYLDLKNEKHPFAIIDADDYQTCRNFSWSLTRSKKKEKEQQGERVTYYAINIKNVGVGKTRSIYLHRFLINPLSHQVVDHINGNGLDNRRENIRACTFSDNHLNTYRHREGLVLGVQEVRRRRNRKEKILRKTDPEWHKNKLQKEREYFAQNKERIIAYCLSWQRNNREYSRLLKKRTYWRSKLKQAITQEQIDQATKRLQQLELQLQQLRDIKKQKDIPTSQIELQVDDPSTTP